LFVNPEIITPEFIPKTQNRDFWHGYSQPIDKIFLIQGPAYSLYPVNQLTKRTLDDISQNWCPAFAFKSVFKNDKCI